MAKRPKDFTATGIQRVLRAASRERRNGLTERAGAERRSGPPRNDLLPNLVLEMRPIASLKVPRRRVRKADPAQVARVGRSISRVGFSAPILISADGEIIDGITRVAAAIELGLSEVPCVVAGHLTPTELRTLRLALNRLGELGTWDVDALRIEFAELIELDAPVEITGFSPPEIDQLLLDEAVPAHEVGPLEPDPELPAVSRPGDVWVLGEHIVACGDAREPKVYAQLFGPGQQAQLVLTDEPYNVKIAGHVTSGKHREFAMASGELSRGEFARFNCDWMQAALAHLADGGLLATFIDWRSVDVVIAEGEALGLALLNLIVWVKSNAGQGALWRSQHELLPVFKFGKAAHVNNVALGRHGRWRSNVWTYPGASALGSDARRGLKEHPTVKPVAMLEDAILDVTHRGDIVIDPFLGSGSTLIAAEKTGRICRGIEIDPLYVDVIIRRWMALTGGEPKHIRRTGERPPEETPPPKPLSDVPAPLFIADARRRRV